MARTTDDYEAANKRLLIGIALVTGALVGAAITLFLG